MKTPKEKALEFLEGLKMDIIESKNKSIDIESTDIEQIDNCIQLLENQ